MSRRRDLGTLWMVGAALALTVMACGGGSDNPSPTSPDPPPTTGGGGGGGGGGGTPQSTTITIQQGGVPNPSVLTVSPGTRVTFINNDSVNHEVQDDPHPTHGDCPAIQQVGFLTPGQSRQTGELTVIRTCGWHDHNNPTVNGSIRIQ